MSDIIDTIRANAAAHSRTVILPEAGDERILRAAQAVHNAGIARPILLGSPEEIRAHASSIGLELGGIGLYDVEVLSQSTSLQQHLHSRKWFADLTPAQLKTVLQTPLTLACCLLATGEVDACVAGAVHTTGEVLQQGLRVVGTAEQSPLLSSFFLMVFDSPPVDGLDFALYADCAININPDSDQLAAIAAATADSARDIFGLEPRLALLSFSTSGSADHPDVEKVINAKHDLNARFPELKVIGDVQFDAALLPKIRRLKMGDGGYTQAANVYIFPDLDAGNIAYKITERLAGAKAVGPILQGLRKPLNDLSRGADVESIVNTIALSCLQAEGGSPRA